MKGDVFLRRKIGIVIGIVFLAGVIILSQKAGEYLLKQTEKSRETKGEAEELVIVVDSGHGGSDPGKIGVNDVHEKDINLQIAQKVQNLLEEKQIKVIMTRKDENSLASGKVEDLKARVELINQTKPALAVSIHQNSYPDAAIHGAQVFYFTHSKAGENAAKVIQEALREVDAENHRQAKANDTYYMLKKTEVPIVIVECGFLSNVKEAKQLCEDAYQTEIASAIVKGILTAIP